MVKAQKDVFLTNVQMSDGSFKQGQQFVAAANQKLTSGAIQQAVTNAKQLATGLSKEKNSN